MVKPVDASQPSQPWEEEADSGRLGLRAAGGAEAGLPGGFADAQAGAFHGHGRPEAPPRHSHVPHECEEDSPRRTRRINRLVNTLERDVIPRLVRAHRAVIAPPVIDRAPSAAVTADDLATVTALAMRGDPAETFAYVEALQGRGVALERIYLDLLGLVAQRLGTMWEEDACDFATVTIGLSALQHVVLQASRQFWRVSRRDHPMRRGALAAAPGEQHTFGLVIVAEFFRRAGWEVWSDTSAGGSQIVAQVHAESFAFAGFTLAGEERLAGLAGIIRRVRRSSLNRGIGILVGGPLFVAHPELVLQVGADATAVDGPQAVLQAETLLALDGARA